MSKIHNHNSHNHNSHVHSNCIRSKANFNKSFLIATIANSLCVIMQVVFAIIANSSSLMADAIHNLGDVVGLILSWVANWLLAKKASSKRTYGYKKLSIIASGANAMMLVFSSGIIVAESCYSLFVGKNIVAAPIIILLAVIGILINGLSAALFFKGQDDLNIKSAYLHLFYDALISVGVVISALLIWQTKWYWLDPIVAIIIAIIILKGTWGIFVDSFALLADAVPKNISFQAVQEFILRQDAIISVHNLHIWAISTQENALSAHLVVSEKNFNEKDLKNLINNLKKHFKIHHVTIQIEEMESFCEIHK